MSEQNSGEKTITIKKEDLWKYSTFVLLALVVIVGIVAFSGESTTSNTIVPTPNQPVSLDAFISNPDLYPSIGPQDAKNVVVEFSDFQCPFCAMAAGLANWTSDYQAQYGSLIGVAKNVQDLAENGEVRFIYVPWSFLGAESTYASQAALCANDQGKFKEMHDAIFEAHDGKENNGKYNKDKLEVMAAKISGIDTVKFNACLENDTHLSDLQKIASDVSSVGVTGTPTFFVNGQKVSSSWPAVQAALK